MSANSFGGSGQQGVYLNPLNLYMWRQKPTCIQFQLKKKRLFSKAFVVPVKQLYKPTNKMHYLYVFILQFFLQLSMFRKTISFIIHDLLYSATLYKPCKRV